MKYNLFFTPIGKMFHCPHRFIELDFEVDGLFKSEQDLALFII